MSRVITGVSILESVIVRDRAMSIGQDVPMTSPADPDRTLADFFAEIEHTGGPSLTADDHCVLAADAAHDESVAERDRGQPREADTGADVRRPALDEMVKIAENAGMYERTADPRRMR